MKKERAAILPKRPNPLDSKQWISQSTKSEDRVSGDGSASPSVTISPTPTIDPVPTLYITRNGKDVTGKHTAALSGEAVTLNAEIDPRRYNGKDWKWPEPPLLMKDFSVTLNPINGHPEEGGPVHYDPADFLNSSMTYRWVDGGAKAVTVTATVNGKKLTAATTVDVTRPTIDILVLKNQPVIVKNPNPPNPGDQLFMAKALIRFISQNPSHVGILEWVQVAVYDGTETLLNGQVIPRHENGQDGCIYPNSVDSFSQDNPSMGFIANDTRSRDFALDAEMFLLWKSKRAGSIWVPLRKVHW
jgi:hypothetical protein